jgi:D-arabinose 1-dehydrogenase-like Zn-dependent alcohol dehydrogenase
MTETMRAVVITAPQMAGVEKVARLGPRPGEVVVDVQRVGTCLVVTC